MKQASIDRLQGAIFRQLGDDVEVFAPGADVGADEPVWAGRAVHLVDQSAEAPGDGLSYEQKVQGFSFRASDAPPVPQGALLRYGGRTFVVDERITQRGRKAQHAPWQGDGLGNARSSNKQPD